MQVHPSGVSLAIGSQDRPLTSLIAQVRSIQSRPIRISMNGLVDGRGKLISFKYSHRILSLFQSKTPMFPVTLSKV